MKRAACRSSGTLAVHIKDIYLNPKIQKNHFYLVQEIRHHTNLFFLFFLASPKASQIILVENDLVGISRAKVARKRAIRGG